MKAFSQDSGECSVYSLCTSPISDEPLRSGKSVILRERLARIEEDFVSTIGTDNLLSTRTLDIFDRKSGDLSVLLDTSQNH
jgi:hypothetical protein